jgi:TP901 family phage tail tape measure protein
MATDLLVRIDATTVSYEAAMARASKSTLTYETALRKAQLAQMNLERQMNKDLAAVAATRTRAIEAQAAAYDKAGKSMLKMGAAVGIGLGLAAKAAVDWETAWTGVLKTVDASPAEFDKIEAGLRTLVKTMPESADAILEVAANAGQLGVAGKDIVGFTKVMVKMGTATNLTADQASTDMAKFSNIMQIPTSEVGKLGAALVDLGNHGASTESDIDAMALRIAAAGHQSGLSAGDVLGFANALSSLGVQAESGGSNISRTFQMMNTAVAEGGAQLEGFAKVAGETAAQFKQDYETDAAGAVVKFVAGLERIHAAGGDVYGTLAALHITSIRQIDVLTRLAGSGDLLTKSLQTGNKAYAEGTALNKEYNRRLDTTAAQLQIAQNNVRLFAASLGEGLLPVLGKVAHDGTVAFGWLDQIPDSAKAGITDIAALTAVFGLFGGGALLAMSKIVKLRLAMRSAEVEAVAMRTTMGATAAALGKSFAVIAAADFAAHMINRLNAADTSVNTLSDDLARLAHGGGLSPELSGTSVADAVIFGGQDPNKVIGQTDDLVHSIHMAYEAKSKVAQISNLGFDTSETNQMQAIDEALTHLSKTDPAAAEDAFMRLVHAGNLAGLSTEHAMQMFPGFLKIWTAGYKKMADGEQAVGAGARAMGQPLAEVGASTTNLGGAIDKTTGSMAKQITTAKDLVAALDKLNSKNLDLRSTARDWQAAVDAATASLKANGKTLNNNTEEGRANNAALDAMASSAIAHAAAMEKDGKSVTQVNRYLVESHDRLVETARDMGMGKKQAEVYADAVLKIPKTADTKATFDHKEADSDIRAWKTYVQKLMSDIPDEIVNISLSARALKVENTLSHFSGTTGVAAGGPISGPGTGTSDSIPAMLSAGEHVWTAAEVSRAGGHGVVEGLRRLAMLGELPRRGDISAFAGGGPVVLDPHMSQSGTGRAVGAVDKMFDAITAQLGRALSKRLNKALTQMSFGSGSPLGMAGSLTPAGIVRGQEFARSQAGAHYAWGGVGPYSRGYDCSGFQSAVLNAAHNAYPYRRLGSTASMPWAGSQPGVGLYTIGWSTNVGGSGIGHTSGNIGGLGVESNGTDGVVTGSAALSPLSSMFNGLMHYDRGGILKPGLTLAHNTTSRNEVVLAPRAPGRGGRGGSRRLVIEGPMTLDVDGHQIAGVVRGIVREEVTDEFHYMTGG